MIKTDGEAGKSPTIIFWIAALFILIFQLGVNQLWGSEDRWAEVAREMLMTGDWFHPAINSEVYFDKPLLSYWAIVVLAKITGVLNEFIIRLPSALSALVALYATIKFATRMWGEKVGIASGWLLLCGYGFIFQGRLAAADMMNMTAVILAVLWFFQSKDKGGFWSYLLFWVICFGGALTKGLPALAIPLVLVSIYVLLDGTWKKHLKISHCAAFLIGLTVFLLPSFISASLPLPDGFTSGNSGLSSLELVWRENIVRVFNPFDHDDEPFFIYLLHIPKIMAPWSVLLFIAIAAIVKQWKKLDINTRWLLLTNLVIFLIFSASGSRRWYYILPIAPFLAILIAEYIAGSESYQWRDWWANVHRWLLIIMTGIAIIAIPAIPYLLNLKFLPDDIKIIPAVLIWTMPLVAVPAFIILVFCGKKAARYTMLPQSWATVIVSCTLIMGVFFAVLYPVASSLRNEEEFAYALKEGLSGVKVENIAFFPKVYPKLVYYMNAEKPIPVLLTTDDLKEFVESSDETKYLIAETRSRTVAAILTVLPDFPAENAEYQEDRVPFEKPSARKLKCWKLIPRKE